MNNNAILVTEKFGINSLLPKMSYLDGTQFAQVYFLMLFYFVCVWSHGDLFSETLITSLHNLPLAVILNPNDDIN